jgi:hypothetical protein
LQSGVTVTKATLTLTTTAQYGAASIGVYRITRPLHQVDQPVQLGIAASYPGDVGLEKDPNVLLVEDLRDTNFASRGWRKWTASPEPYGAIVSVADAALGFTPLPGKKAVRVKWASNRNGAMDAFWGFKQKVGYDPEEIYFRYYLMLANDWEPTNENGKLPGFEGIYSGMGGAGGGGWSGSGGWSARGAFETVPAAGNPMHNYPLIGNYVYHADQGGPYGSHVPWRLNGNGYLTKGRWYSIEQYFKVNSIDPATGKGRHDGILRTWVNGRLASNGPIGACATSRDQDQEHLVQPLLWRDGSASARHAHLYLSDRDRQEIHRPDGSAVGGVRGRAAARPGDPSRVASRNRFPQPWDRACRGGRKLASSSLVPSGAAGRSERP